MLHWVICLSRIVNSGSQPLFQLKTALSGMAVVFRSGLLSATQMARIGRCLAPFHRHIGTFPIVQQQQVTSSAVPKMLSTTDDKVKPTSEIPGPRVYPVIGTMFSTAEAMTRKFDRSGVHLMFEDFVRFYGPIFRLVNLGAPPIVVTANPDDAKVLVRATMDNPIRFGMDSVKKVRVEAANNYFQGKGGLLTENGEEWKRLRSRFQTPMMKPKNIHSYLPEMDLVTLDFMDRIADLQNKHGEMPSNFNTELNKWALESVSLVSLNRRLGCLDPNLSSDSEIMDLINTVQDFIEAMNITEVSLKSWRIFPTPSFRKLKKTHESLVRMVDKNIKETEVELLAKEHNPDKPLSLLEQLLLTPGLTRIDVVTLILDMTFAGIDTTSNALIFMLYMLSRHPASQAKLQEEVDSVLGNHKGPITPKHLAQLSYMKAVVKETLRLYPITLGSAKLLDKDLVLSGYLVPKGHVVFLLNLSSSQDEKLFPRAMEFVPERWLRHRPLGHIHPYSSLPFGAGTRMCLGRRIAEQEIYTFLARIMQRFTVDYKYADMEMITRLLLVPSQPARFTFNSRR